MQCPQGTSTLDKFKTCQVPYFTNYTRSHNCSIQLAVISQAALHIKEHYISSAFKNIYFSPPTQRTNLVELSCENTATLKNKFIKLIPFLQKKEFDSR